MKARIRVAALAALGLAAATPVAAAEATAIFASGCFWCTEADFEKLPGVIEVESGYIGGRSANPSYQEVSAGTTGHAEAARIRFDPERIGYAQLLAHYWRNVDPTVKDRQFCDVGTQYRSAIFYLDEEQRRLAEASLDALRRSGRFPNVYTEVVAATTFYPAEAYHQDYYKKNPLRYNFYRQSCGRDARLAELWGGK